MTGTLDYSTADAAELEVQWRADVWAEEIN
jgi:hypothetical protein